MIAGAVAERVGLQVREPADDVDVALQRFERLQGRRQLEVAPGRRRDPLILDDAVGDIDEAEARRAPSARPESAGTIASRNGSASVAPMPRSNVRRANAFFVMNIASSRHLRRFA